MAVLNDRFSDENGVRLNKLGITNQQDLTQAESDSSIPRLKLLNQQGGIKDGQYDQAHLKQVHERLFGGVYQWAGETRADREFQGHKDTRVTGFRETMTYAPHQEIPERLDAIGAQLNRENNLKGLSAEQFAERAAYYLDQYNHAHAFRDGNGRTIQATFTQLGKEAGYDVDFNRASPEILNRSRDLAIVRQYPPAEAAKNLQPLKEMFQQIITPTAGPIGEGLRAPSQAVPTPELSPAMKAMDARRELEVTGYRVASVVANMPGAGNWEQGIQLGQQVEAVNLDPKAIQGKSITEFQQAADKILKHPAMKDTPLDLADAQRLKTASVQVLQLAEGKELVTPQQQQQQPAASAAKRVLVNTPAQEYSGRSSGGIER
ncbi:filamentation induced by cAMP protein Fic [Hymenobacter roseosalivarius DSM 11622]|uniref:protein adenylyltransferase n=1 Tax=Hymenobacter roseosalivarius DSM 11622 TaxID=645990 RepID=A0A1W1UE63_9BACT|nr:Fic family protein [Hymenobacter roseosalivarius]SMB79386.1 filamentation induced by cAMP protein Fic [Hymenobacter roseosalivarius DSM 11622]